MTTVRRTYLYLLACAGLAMWSIAVANLAQVLIDLALQSSAVRAEGYVRDTISLNAAAALVGLPAWLVHWWWIQRSARSDPRERASTLRRLYVYLVLASAMLIAASSASDALRQAFGAIAGIVPTNAWLNVLRPLPFTAIGLVVWLGHWRVAQRDHVAVGENGGSASLRRWYLYGVAFVGLLVLLTGAQALAETLWHAAAQPARSTLASLPPGAAGALVGLAVWLAHSVLLPARMPDVARRDDGPSVLRSVYLFLALAVGVAGTLAGLSQLLYYAVGRLFGVDHPGGVGGDLRQAAAGPASIALVYGAAWAYQRDALRRQASAFSEAPRQAGIRRLYTSVVSLLALAVLASGIAGLLWTLGDVLFNAPAATTGDGWRGQVALFSTVAIVGLPVWLFHWRPIPAEDAESASLARRLYLYLSLIGAMLTLIGSLAAALYRVIGLGLGDTSRVSVLTDLAHALAVALVATIVAVYHWRVLRADARRTEAEVAPAEARLVVELRAADPAGLEQALSALQASGVQVKVVG
jgi:Domain of unknown function (DUF5671)